MNLKKRYYKQYFTGGEMALVQMAQQLQGGIVDAVMPTNEFGNQSALGAAMKGNSQLGTIGAVMGYIKGRKQEKQDKLRRFHNQLEANRQQRARGAAAISADPALITGRPGEEFYAMGGSLKGRYYDVVKAKGGFLKPLSKNSAEVQGPSHEQGGVDIPQFQSEVEGKESIQGDYVFSDRLGFADQHKKLARAIGKIEQKPATPDRINSLKSLYLKVESLKAQQEDIRNTYNLG